MKEDFYDIKKQIELIIEVQKQQTRLLETLYKDAEDRDEDLRKLMNQNAGIKNDVKQVDRALHIHKDSIVDKVTEAVEPLTVQVKETGKTIETGLKKANKQTTGNSWFARLLGGGLR